MLPTRAPDQWSAAELVWWIRAERPRLTFGMISLAFFVQINGLRSSIHCEIQVSMASVRTSMLLNDPVRRRSFVSCANEPPTRFTHGEFAGVKCRSHCFWRGFASHSRTAGRCALRACQARRGNRGPVRDGRDTLPRFRRADRRVRKSAFAAALGRATTEIDDLTTSITEGRSHLSRVGRKVDRDGAGIIPPAEELRLQTVTDRRNALAHLQPTRSR